MQWYYIRNGQQAGPVDEHGLRALAREGGLGPEDLVWNESMGGEWAAAASVPGLTFSAVESTPAGAPPPPLPSESAGHPSCVLPVGPAWESMIRMLFRPLRIGKWFALGFAAWLAHLGESGGSFNLGGGSWRHPGGADLGRIDLREATETVQSFLRQHGDTIVAATLLVVVLGAALGLLILWVRSRGKFVFLDNVVNDRTEISAPWRAFARLGNSLFAWSILYGLVCLLVFAALAVAAVFGVLAPCLHAGRFIRSVMPVLATIGFLAVVFGLVTAFIGRFLEDFVVPIMFRSGATAFDAWGRFLNLLRPNFWRFVLYGLFYMVLRVAAGMAVLMLVVITCCTAGCLLLIPYIAAVVTLPVTVFFRLFSIGYLAQLGPAYRLEPGVPTAGYP